MPSRSDTESRAEARRRARMVARGELEELDQDQPAEEAEEPRRRSFIDRIIPPAPPLRGKPDPLADFTYEGAAKQYVAWVYLLGQNPLAWVVPGLLWGGLIASQYVLQDQMVVLIASVTQYIALIAAGWIGWQRPWLFGTAAGLLGLILWAAVVAVDPSLAQAQGTARPALGDIVVYFLYQAPLQILLGMVAGWYGGYLRRRLASQPQSEQRGRNRR